MGCSYFQWAPSGCALGDPAEVPLWNLFLPLFTCCVCTWIPPTLVESWLFPPTPRRASIKHFKYQNNNEPHLLAQMGLNSKSISFAVSWLTLAILPSFEINRPDFTWLIWLLSFFFYSSANSTTWNLENSHSCCLTFAIFLVISAQTLSSLADMEKCLLESHLFSSSLLSPLTHTHSLVPFFSFPFTVFVTVSL